MVKWIIKRYVRKLINGFLKSNTKGVQTTVEQIDKYKAKLIALISFVEKIKDAVYDTELTVEELENITEEANKLVEALF